MPRTVQGGCDRAGARIGHRSPGAGEDLIRPPAKEERGRAAVHLVEIVPGFRVEKWYCSSAALEAAAAILVRSAQPLHHAVAETLVVVVNLTSSSPPHEDAWCGYGARIASRRRGVVRQPPCLETDACLIAKTAICRNAIRAQTRILQLEFSPPTASLVMPEFWREP
jgi:hypothetical protein